MIVDDTIIIVACPAVVKDMTRLAANEMTANMTDRIFMLVSELALYFSPVPLNSIRNMDMLLNIVRRSILVLSSQHVEYMTYPKRADMATEKIVNTGCSFIIQEAKALQVSVFPGLLPLVSIPTFRVTIQANPCRFVFLSDRT